MQAIGWFLLAVLGWTLAVTAFFGAFMSRARGPMGRLVQHVAGLAVIAITLDLWCAVFGVLGVVRWPGAVGYGTAIGWTLGTVFAWVIRLTRGSVPVSQQRRPAGLLAPFEVIATSWICTIALLFSLDLQTQVKASAIRSAGIDSQLLVLLRADLASFVFGFAWAQILTNVMLKSLDKGAVDWQWSRGRRYLVMGTPVLLGLLVVSYQYPGATVGLVFRGLVLLVGWRFTSQPPAGTWKVCREILASRRTKAGPGLVKVRPETGGREGTR